MCKHKPILVIVNIHYMVFEVLDLDNHGLDERMKELVDFITRTHTIQDYLRKINEHKKVVIVN